MKTRDGSRKNVSKTRLLHCYLGRENDNKQDQLTGMFDASGWTKQQFHTWALSSYRDGKAARDQAVTYLDFLGAESINSTSSWWGSMNNCTHLKHQCVQLPFLFGIQDYRYSNRNLYGRYRKYGAPTYWKEAGNVALEHGFQPDLMFSARAYWSMRPKFQSDVSLINSIFELKDFSDVASFMFGKNKSANSRCRQASKALNHFNRLFNKNPVVTGAKYGVKAIGGAIRALSRPYSVVADLTKLAANAQLTYALAIMPTIRDVMSIHAAAQLNVYELAKEFKGWGDEGSRSHYSERDVIHTSVVPTDSYNNYWNGNGKHIERVLTATMVSYYRVLWERLEERYPRWWGLEIGVDEIWNMLPLSFVLDYIWTVGKSLDYMDRDDTVDILSTEYCESCKVVASSGFHIIQDARVNALIIDGVFMPPRSKRQTLLVSGTAGTYYQRVVKDPYKGPALPIFKAPSSSQTANLLALARCLLF